MQGVAGAKTQAPPYDQNLFANSIFLTGKQDANF
jgi:hypothetical protein